ncbi:MAG: hypothetical protein GY948_04210 [Alphaproteobacteria bacterium]|nr:hypothetical protein [Alphaproteobacteria bacterium]
MDSQAQQGIWGDEFHFLPFVSIMGASTIGAVNASMAMARDCVPGSVGIIFLLAWGIVTCMLLVAGNQLFCRKDLARKLNRSSVARTGSGAVFVLVTLFAVYGTYSAVSSVSGAQARTAVVTPTQPSAAPVTTTIQAAAPKIQAIAPKVSGTGSVHYQTSSQPYVSTSRLPAPIAPPAGELVGLPKPASILPLSATAKREQGSSVTKRTAKPKRKAIKKRRNKKNTKPSVAKSIIAKPAKPATFPTVDSAAAPAPTRQLRGLTNVQNGSNFSGKSTGGCTSRTCRENDLNR